MQCVASEPNFAHYYCTSYRYEDTNLGCANFEEFCGSDSASIGFFEGNQWKKEADKSPKKSNYKTNRRRDYNKKLENVGLYRNLGVAQNSGEYGAHVEQKLNDRSGLRTRKVGKFVEPVKWSLPSEYN